MPVTEQQGSPRTSVPAVSQSRSETAPPASQPRLLVGSWIRWSAGTLLAIGLIIGILVWGVDPDPTRYLAASSWHSWAVKLGTVNCVSIKRAVYDEKPYSERDLAEAVTDILKIKTVLLDANDTTCPWGLSATVVPRTDTAISYNGLWSRYLVSMGICEKPADGRLNPNRCLNKEIDVFTPRVSPHKLFQIGLVGLARPQSREFEAFQVSK
jgi:hypothetical protein